MITFGRRLFLKILFQSAAAASTLIIPGCDLGLCCISARPVAKQGYVKTFCQSWDVTFHIWMKHSWSAGRIAQSESSCVFPLEFFLISHRCSLSAVSHVSDPLQNSFLHHPSQRAKRLGPSARLCFEDNNRSGWCSCYVITHETNWTFHYSVKAASWCCFSVAVLLN